MEADAKKEGKGKEKDNEKVTNLSASFFIRTVFVVIIDATKGTGEKKEFFVYFVSFSTIHLSFVDTHAQLLVFYLAEGAREAGTDWQGKTVRCGALRHHRAKGILPTLQKQPLLRCHPRGCWHK